MLLILSCAKTLQNLQNKPSNTTFYKEIIKEHSLQALTYPKYHIAHVQVQPETFSMPHFLNQIKLLFNITLFTALRKKLIAKMV